MKSIQILISVAVMICMSACNSPVKTGNDDLFSKENLVAWCIVPFDASHRTPDQRAEMLNDLGITKFAYDYRDEHIPHFKEEIGVLKEHGIELSAVWFWLDPKGEEILNEANRQILDILGETGTKTGIWVSFPGEVFEGISDSACMEKAIRSLTVVLNETEKIGCTMALYNHGGWFGEPENLVRIIKAMGSEKIRIVYNFHHGHHQLDRFPELLDLMLPYLSAININGMKAEGPMILTVGQGDRELEMLRNIAASGYDGPIGILGHTDGEDIAIVLERNLKGLEALRLKL
ncbi:MAG: TIM barrel protein [Bacteroidota bacterium]